VIPGDPEVTPEQVKTETVERLTTRQVCEILGFVRAATEEDGVAPLSEQVLLAVRDHATTDGTDPYPTHFLAYAGTHLAGYAHLDRGAKGNATTAELVVDPSGRRKGVGAALIHSLEAASRAPTLQLWSHGDLAGARALALRGGYSIMRELWQMRRSLRSDTASLPAVRVPQGFWTRHFVVGHDEEAWLRVNARAFVNHPEQGRMTRADLERRIAEPWFDAEGFILIEDTRGLEPVLAASHWTKVVAGEVQTAQPAVHPSEGEVYVVGVEPAYQGLGLGRTVTVLGLEHLRARGLSEAMLYVEADNRAAVATYTHLDFARSAVDIMYSGTVH